MDFSFGRRAIGHITGNIQPAPFGLSSSDMSKPPAHPSKPKPVRFSYSTSDQPALQRAVIQAIEKMGGQRKLKKLYFQHQKSAAGGGKFFDAAIRLLKLNVLYDEADFG